jgi:hypothetical protein
MISLLGLLDQPDPEHRQPAQVALRVELEGARHDDPDHTAQERRQPDHRPADRVRQSATGDERHERRRYHRRAEQDRRRHEVGVLGSHERALDGQEQRRTHGEHTDPGVPPHGR